MVKHNCTRFSQNYKLRIFVCTPSSRSSLTSSRFICNALSSDNRPDADIMEWSAGWPPWISIGRRVARAVSPSSGRAGRRNVGGRPPLTARLRLARRVARSPMVLAPPAGSRRTTGGTFRRLVRQLRFARALHRHCPVPHGRARPASRRRLYRPMCREADTRERCASSH
jgi:hypothetical protein